MSTFFTLIFWAMVFGVVSEENVNLENVSFAKEKYLALLMIRFSSVHLPRISAFKTMLVAVAAASRMAKSRTVLFR